MCLFPHLWMLTWMLDSPVDSFLNYNFNFLDTGVGEIRWIIYLYFIDNIPPLPLLIIPHSQYISSVNTSSYSLLANTVFKINTLFKEVHILLFILQGSDNRDSSNSCPNLTADFSTRASSQAQRCKGRIGNNHHRLDGSKGNKWLILGELEGRNNF